MEEQDDSQEVGRGLGRRRRREAVRSGGGAQENQALDLY